MLTMRARGQTLPIWALGIATTLVIAFGALQYGQTLRWQIRAQNAADAAAAGALSVQTANWNQQMAMLYASSVEEYRIKYLIGGMIAASNGDRGCGGSIAACAPTYVALRNAYVRAVDRYTKDVQLVNRTSLYTMQQAQSDAKAIVADFQRNCGQAGGGDCAFSYNVVDVSPRAGALNDVEQNAGNWIINNGNAAAVKADYVPAQIEIVTCAKVAPIVPGFMQFTPPTFTAIGRAAATSAMVTQEWIQPGRIVNPSTGAKFQAPEPYGAAGTFASGPANHDWFTVDYGGNTETAVAPYGYTGNISTDEFSVATGWWSTIPVKPYRGTLGAGTFACTNGGGGAG